MIGTDVGGAIAHNLPCVMFRCPPKPPSRGMGGSRPPSVALDHAPHTTLTVPPIAAPATPPAALGTEVMAELIAISARASIEREHRDHQITDRIRLTLEAVDTPGFQPTLQLILTFAKPP